MTTVPAPLAAKARSTHSRGRPWSATAGVARRHRPSAARSASSPTPAGAATSTTSASARKVPASVGHLEPGRSARSARPGRPW